MEIGYCSKCNNIDSFNGNNVCQKCGERFIGLGVDITEWNVMDNNQMLDCIEAAIAKDEKANKPIKKDHEQPLPSVKKTKTASKENVGAHLVPGICPQCGGKIKVDKRQDAAVCEHCGTPFIVEKAVNIVNNNIKLESEDIDAFVDKMKDRDASLRDRVKKARNLLSQFYNLDTETNQKRETLKRYKASSYKSNGFVIGGVVMLVIALGMFGSGTLANILLGIVALGIGGFLIRMYIVKIKVEKAEKATTISATEREIARLEERADNSYRQIAEILPELPEEYYDGDTLAELDKIFTTNRADNMRQALALIDERNHRRKMEEFERQNVELQKESNELQRQSLEVSKQNLQTSQQSLKAQKRGNRISATNALVNTAHLASDVYKILK